MHIFTGINPYQFAFNDPIALNDPLGLAPENGTQYHLQERKQKSNGGGSGSNIDFMSLTNGYRPDVGLNWMNQYYGWYGESATSFFNRAMRSEHGGTWNSTGESALFTSSSEARDFANAHFQVYTVRVGRIQAADGTEFGKYEQHLRIKADTQNGGVQKCPRCPDLEISLIDQGQNREPYTGILGWLEFFWTGGNEDGFLYNINGEVIGRSPVMGLPPDFIGGPLRRGQQAIKLGRYLFNPNHFHRFVKPDILSKAGKFSHIVGTNPDISLKGTKIILNGTKTGPFRGKSFETGLDILDFIF